MYISGHKTINILNASFFTFFFYFTLYYFNFVKNAFEIQSCIWGLLNDETQQQQQQQKGKKNHLHENKAINKRKIQQTVIIPKRMKF